METGQSIAEQLINAATQVYLAREQTPQQQLQNAPADQQTGLSGADRQTNVQAQPVAFQVAGVPVNKTALIVAGALLAGLIAWRAVKG